MRLPTDIGFQFPKVLINECIIPIIGKPITRIPQMDNIIAAVGEADKKVQSTCGMAS